MYRTIRHHQDNPALAKQQGCTSEDLLNAWIVANAIEQIADQVKRITKLMNRVKGVNKKDWNELMEIYSRAGDLYTDAIKAYTTKDTKLAYILGKKKSEVIKDCKKLHLKCQDIMWMPILLEKIKFMVGFTQPICKTVTT